MHPAKWVCQGFRTPARSVGGIGRSVDRSVGSSHGTVQPPDRCLRPPARRLPARPVCAGLCRAVPCGTRWRGRSESAPGPWPPPPARYPSGLPVPRPPPPHSRPGTYGRRILKESEAVWAGVDVEGRGAERRGGGTGGERVEGVGGRGRSTLDHPLDHPLDHAVLPGGCVRESEGETHATGATGLTVVTGAGVAGVRPDLPPIAETSWCTMASPRPEPLSLRDGRWDET